MNKKFFAKKRFKVLVGVILLLVAGAFVSAKFFDSSAKEEYVTVKIEKGDLVQTVSEVGVVKASDEVELSFLSGGRLEKKFFKIGDEVKAGDRLAELDAEALLIQKQQAVSILASARASLEKLLSGSSASDLAVIESQVREAQKANESSLNNLDKIRKVVAEDIRQAEKNLNDLQQSGALNQTTYEQAIVSAKTVLDNAKATYQKGINDSIDTAINNISSKLAVANTALDNVNTILTNDDLNDFLSSKDKSYLNSTKTAYSEAKALATAANSSFYSALQAKDEYNIKKSVDEVLNYLNKTVDTLKYCYSSLEASTIPQASLDVYKSTINSQLSYVNAAVSVVQADKQSLSGAYLAYSSNISSAENSLRASEVALNNAIDAAKNTLASVRLGGEQKIAAAEASVRASQESWDVAKNQLAKVKAPARSEDVVLANAQVAQAQSSLDLLDKQIKESALVAPIDGRIVSDNFESGEQISPGRTVFSLLGKNNYEIEIDISESDIAKVKTKDEAEITLDALGSEKKLTAQVEFIEPAATVIQDVVYYKVVLKFLEAGNDLSFVKPGMTANAVIITAKQEQVLMVPERAIIDKAGGKVIRLLREKRLIESPVKTGLRGDGGLIEIISGAALGDEAVVFVKTKK